MLIIQITGGETRNNMQKVIIEFQFDSEKNLMKHDITVILLGSLGQKIHF